VASYESESEIGRIPVVSSGFRKISMPKLRYAPSCSATHNTTRYD